MVATKKAEKQAVKEQQEYEQKIDNMRTLYANDGYNFITVDGQLVTWEEYEQLKIQEEAAAESERKKKIAAGSLLALGATVAVMAAAGNNKKTKKHGKK